MADQPNNTNRLFAVLGVVAIAAAVFALLRTGAAPSRQPAAGDETVQVAGTDANDSTARGSARRTEKPLGHDEATSDDEAAEYLREQFGATIENKRSQIKAIEKLIGYLMKHYPKDWQDRLQALLAKAFPGLADQLYAQYQNMTSYNEWLKAHREELAQMQPDDRRAALRDARAKYFGADADEIFAETLRHDQIYDAKQAIEQSTDKSLGQKLDTYRKAIDEAYGEEAPQFLERRQAELTNDFLTMPSVQHDLASLSPQQRAVELEAIRRGMGMDDEALGRWRALDDERDQTWQAGERYMEKRDEITRTFQGDEQARRLAALRTEMFPADADVIQEEEGAGFFRFGHPRVYGKE